MIIFIRYSLSAVLFFSLLSSALAGQTFNPFTGKSDKCVTIQETDASPADTQCKTILVPNSSMTDNGDGTYSLSFSAGSGDVTSVGDCATGDCFTGASGNTFTFKGGTSGTTALKPTAIAGTTTLTLPAATDTLVGKDTTDTLTNKTMAAASNVLDADTAVALAADPADCGANTYATTIAASGALTCAQVLQNQIGDATGSSTINMDGFDLNYIFDNPSGSFNITANGAYTSHGVLTVKQQTGNPGASHLVHLEANDADVTLLHLLHNQDSASFQQMIVESDSATPAANDEMYQSWKFSDSAGNQDEFFRLSVINADPTTTSEDGGLTLDLMKAGVLTEAMTLSSTGALNTIGAITGSNLSGTNTGDNTVATTGDSATSFFSSGTLEVAIGGTGTTTSTGTGAVVLGTSPTIATPTLTLQDGNGSAPTTDGVIKYDRTTEILQVGDGTITRSFPSSKVIAGFSITNGNTAIDATVTDPVACQRIANNSVITGWYIDCDASGSIVLDVWKNTWDDTPEVNGDSIAGTEKPTLSTDVSASDTALGSMTTDWNSGQNVCIEIESATTVTKCRVQFVGYLD